MTLPLFRLASPVSFQCLADDSSEPAHLLPSVISLIFPPNLILYSYWPAGFFNKPIRVYFTHCKGILHSRDGYCLQHFQWLFCKALLLEEALQSLWVLVSGLKLGVQFHVTYRRHAWCLLLPFSSQWDSFRRLTGQLIWFPFFSVYFSFLCSGI